MNKLISDIFHIFRRNSILHFNFFFWKFFMKFYPDFATNSRKEWRVSFFQSNLRKQIRKLLKILKSVKIVQYFSLSFSRVLRRSPLIGRDGLLRRPYEEVDARLSSQAGLLVIGSLTGLCSGAVFGTAGVYVFSNSKLERIFY